MRKVIVTNKDKVSKNEINHEEISLSGKVNFMIGKNNSGKTRFANHLNEHNLSIEENGNVKKLEIIYMSNNNNFIGDEVRNETSSIIKDEKGIINEELHDVGVGNFIDRISNKDYSEKEIEISSTNNELIDEFIKNKRIYIKKEVKSNLHVEIDGYSESESGTGESRMNYLIYLRNEVYRIYEIDFNFDFNYDVIFNFLTQEDSFIRVISDFVSKIKKQYDVVIEQKNRYKSNSFWNSKNITMEDFVGYLFFNIVNSDPNHIEHSTEEQLVGDLINFMHESRWKNKDIYNISVFTKIKEIINNFGLIMDEKSLMYPKMKFDELLIIIDEPEKFLHYEYYDLFYEIVNNILKISGVDIKFLFITHSERILRYFSEYLENLNISFKKNGIIRYKNIFNNDATAFIDKINSEYLSLKNKILKSNPDTKNKINYWGKFSLKFIYWFLTNSENVKMFFSSNLICVEGWGEQMLLTNQDRLFSSSSLIKLDGLHNILIINQLIAMNEEVFNNIKIIVDLDTNLKHKVGKKVTYNTINYELLKRLNEIKSNCVSIHSILFGDICNLVNHSINNYFNPLIYSKYYENEIRRVINYVDHKEFYFLMKNQDSYEAEFVESVKSIDGNTKFDGFIFALAQYAWLIKRERSLITKISALQSGNFENSEEIEEIKKIALSHKDDFFNFIIELSKRVDEKKINLIKEVKKISLLDVYFYVNELTEDKSIFRWNIVEFIIEYLKTAMDYEFIISRDLALEYITNASKECDKVWTDVIIKNIDRYLSDKLDYKQEEFEEEIDSIWDNSGENNKSTSLIDLSILSHRKHNESNYKITKDKSSMSILINGFLSGEDNFFIKTTIYNTYMNDQSRINEIEIVDSISESDLLYIVWETNEHKRIYGPLSRKEEIETFLRDLKSLIHI